MPVNKQVLSPDEIRAAAFGLMTPEQLEFFKRELEIDFAISEPGLGRFRVAVFYQRGYPAMVLRYITADMPKLDQLGPPRRAAGPDRDAPRPDPDGRGHGLRKIHDAGGDDQSPQRALLGPYRHDRGPDRIPARQQALDRQSARGGAGHQKLRARAARCHARRPGCDPDRRSARSREHDGGHQPGRYRAPGALDPARQQLRRDHGPDHQHVPARSAQAGHARPLAIPAGHTGAAAGAGQGSAARGRGRGDAQYAAYRRAHQARAMSVASRRPSGSAASGASRVSTSRCSSSTRPG